MYLNTIYPHTTSSSHTSMSPHLCVLSDFCRCNFQTCLCSSSFPSGSVGENIFSTSDSRPQPPRQRSCRSPTAADTTSCGEKELKVDISTERCINETSPPQPRCLRSVMPILETNQIALSIAFLSYVKYFRKSPRRSPYKHTTRRLNRPLSKM